METFLKILIIGDSTVGKTSFVHRYVQNYFHPNYKSTIGVDFALKEVCLKDSDTRVKIQLWDVGGQDCMSSMNRIFFKDSHACILMFDLTQRHTFANVLKWKAELDSKTIRPDGKNVPCILLANKNDIPVKCVQEEEIQMLCSNHDFLSYFIVSVATGHNVNEAMNFLLERVHLTGLVGECGIISDMSSSYEHICLRSKACSPDSTRCIPCNI